MSHRRAYVFFLAADPHPWRRILRLCLRRPATGWKAFRRRWVQSWGDSALFHVSVSDGQVVLDPAHSGNCYHSHEKYSAEQPDIALAFEVPLTRSMNLGDFQGRPGEVWWRAALKFLTRGRIQTGDCVDTVKQALGKGGVAVPDIVTTPKHLKDWLYTKGFPNAIFI